MKIYLRDENKEWKLYTFDSFYDAKKEFKERNISTAENCIIKNFVKIDEGAYIGSNAIVSEDCQIGSYSVVGKNSILRQGVVIGESVGISTGVVIDDFAKIGSYSTIGEYCHISYRAVVEPNTDLKQNLYISFPQRDRCISTVGNNKIFGGCYGEDIMNTSFNDIKKDVIAKHSKKNNIRELNVYLDNTEYLIKEVIKPFYLFTYLRN